MSGVAILLALASTVRPTSLAAVTALLVSKRPQRLLLAYILAGFVVSVVIGVLAGDASSPARNGASQDPRLV